MAVINYQTFDYFIQTTNGSKIGAGECWDYANLIWAHLGRKLWTYPPSNPQATNHGVKWCVMNLEARAANTIEHMMFIGTKEQLKRGDIVFTSGGKYGHVGFINEDYNPSKTSFQFYSQNYSGRRYVSYQTYGLSDFVGAFRYDGWNDTPPTPPHPPTPTKRPKTKYKWVLRARKLRDTRQI